MGLTPPSHAKGISERGSPKLTLNQVPHSYCIARAATLVCSLSPWRNMCCPGTVNQNVWGGAGHPIPKCTSESNQNVHAGHPLWLNCRRSVQHWTHEEPSSLFSWAVLGTAPSPNVFTWPEAMLFATLPFTVIPWKNVYFSLATDLSNYWYLKYIQLLPLIHMPGIADYYRG